MLNVRNLPARNLVRVKKSYSGALPQSPFLCLLISSTYSGKTVWILNLLAEKRFKFADQFKKLTDSGQIDGKKVYLKKMEQWQSELKNIQSEDINE